MTEPSYSLRANALGVGSIIFFVVSAAGPLVAIAGGVPVSMLLGNGAGIPAMFAVAVAILLAFAAGYTAMAHHVASAGGFYAFVARGLGGHAGGMAAALAVLGYFGIQLAIYGLLGAASADFLAQLTHGARIPWWVFSFVAMALIAMLGYRQVDLSAKVLSALVIGEYLVVFVLDAAILQSAGAERSLASFTASVVTSGSAPLGLLLCFSAFIGFEATTLYAEEARNPERSIPIATYTSLLVIGGFYIFSSWCLVAAVGAGNLVPALAALQDPTTFAFQLSDRFVGPWLTASMQLLFITSCFAAMLAFHNALARYFFALAREGLLPAKLSITHSVRRSPHIASCTQTLLAFIVLAICVIASVDPVVVLFARFSAVGTLAVIALMALASFAVVAFFWSRAGNLWRIRILPVIATLSLTCVLAFACLRFDALAGGSSPLVRWLPALVGLAVCIGFAMAARLQRRDPARFQNIGESGRALGVAS